MLVVNSRSDSSLNLAFKARKGFAAVSVQSASEDKYDLELPDCITDARSLDPRVCTVFPNSKFSPPDLCYSLLSAPPSQEIEYEGRGIYLRQSRDRVVYLKGSGSPSSFLDNSKSLDLSLLKYPGFGGIGARLFFDDPNAKGAKARIRGAFTLGAALLEAINTQWIMEALAKENNLQNLQACLSSGLPAAIAVVALPDLSEHLNNRKSEELRSLKTDLATDTFGLLSLYAPSSRRVRPDYMTKDDRSAEYSYLIEHHVEAFSMAGKVVRGLLQAGFVYQRPAVHYQNIYDAPDSICPYADATGLFPLGMPDLPEFLPEYVIQGSFLFAPISLIHDKAYGSRATKACKSFFSEILQSEELANSFVEQLKESKKPFILTAALAHALCSIYLPAAEKAYSAYSEILTNFNDCSSFSGEVYSEHNQVVSRQKMQFAKSDFYSLFSRNFLSIIETASIYTASTH